LVSPAARARASVCCSISAIRNIRSARRGGRREYVVLAFRHVQQRRTKLLFSDEWGGGGQPRCRATDKKEWGSDALFTIENNKLKFHGYYKLPAPQTSLENCVAHNGSLIPIPGRDVMVQAWYQGGLSVFDWTDIDHPKEIAFYDRGPVDAERMRMGGSWSAYWYNGVIVSSEIARGMDIYELVPSGLITENELAAAKTVRMPYWNTQDQQKYVWAPSFVVARAYLDQLARVERIGRGRRFAAARASLDAAEKRSGTQRKTALTELATRLNGERPRPGQGPSPRQRSVRPGSGTTVGTAGDG
jgi:hypothetical protein